MIKSGPQSLRIIQTCPSASVLACPLKKAEPNIIWSCIIHR